MSKCDVCGGPMRSHNTHGVCQSNPDCGREYQRRYNVARNCENVIRLTLTDEERDMMNDMIWPCVSRTYPTSKQSDILVSLRRKVDKAMKAKELDDAGGTALDKPQALVRHVPDTR